MKKVTNFIFLLLLTCCCSFCTQKVYTPVDYTKGQIIFGSGGGITGAVQENVLLENGAMFSKENLNTEYMATKKLDKNVVQQMFSNIEFLNLPNIEMNEPGNRYYFLQIKDKDLDHRIVWSGKNAVAREVQNFYEILNHLSKVD